MRPLGAHARLAFPFWGCARRFAETFREAVNAEVHSAAFASNNFRGFSLNFAVLNSKNFLGLPTETTPETNVVLRSAPSVRFSSVEQAPWRRWPVHFGFYAFAVGPVRTENQFRVALIIANIGTFGNLRRQEKVF